MTGDTPEESTGGEQRDRTRSEELVDDGMNEYEAWVKVWEKLFDLEQSGAEA